MFGLKIYADKDVRAIFLIICALIIFFIDNAYATDYPTTGITYNTKEDSSISYDCKLDSSNKLHCDFIKTGVRKKLKKENLEKIRQQEVKQFLAAKQNITSIEGKKFCKRINKVSQVLKKNKSLEGVIKMKPEGAFSDKEYFKGALLLQDAFCKDPNGKNHMNIVNLELKKELDTCIVYSQTFKQSFDWVTDNLNSSVWVVSSKPYGPCGFVQLDRFEAKKDNYSSLFWKYKARRVITNPEGKIASIMCNSFDKVEYIYDWKDDREHKIDCKYVEFSMR